MILGELAQFREIELFDFREHANTSAFPVLIYDTVNSCGIAWTVDLETAESLLRHSGYVRRPLAGDNANGHCWYPAGKVGAA